MILLVLFYVFIIIYYIQILYYIYAHGLIPDGLLSLSDPLFCISNKACQYYYYYYYCCESLGLFTTLCETRAVRTVYSLAD